MYSTLTDWYGTDSLRRNSHEPSLSTGAAFCSQPANSRLYNENPKAVEFQTRLMLIRYNFSVKFFSEKNVIVKQRIIPRSTTQFRKKITCRLLSTMCAMRIYYFTYKKF